MITLTHTAETGTLAVGTSKGAGSAQILKEHHAVEPVQVVAASPVSPSASVCAVTCPGYVPPDESYHPMPLFVKPTVPTTGVVTVYLPAPTTQGTPAKAKAPKAAAQPKQAKAQKASSSKAPAAPKAPKAAKAPKQTAPSVTSAVPAQTTTLLVGDETLRKAS